MESDSMPIAQTPLVPTKGAALAPEVAAELKEITLLGLIKEGDIDTKAMDAIKELPTADALAVLKEFRDTTNLDAVANKSALICTLARSRRAKTRASSRSMGGAGDAKPGPDEAKLKEILERTKYSHEVSTGQRKYGGPPPGWTDSQPGSGHEIYCGKLPKELFEDSLIPMFEKFGTIWDLRLMMDPISGRNRGYCFVTYTDKTHAQDAITGLNNFEVRPGRFLKVNASVANVRLFVGNIPKNRSRDEIKEEFAKHTEGLVDVIVYNTPDDERKKNRGFAFLDYDSHKSASTAKRTLSGGRVRVWGAEVFVEWAEPQDEPDDDTMSKVKVLYVRNLKADITEDQLKEVFEVHGTVERAKRVKGYGFVHFADRESALKAMDALNGTKIGDLEVEISLAKPSSKNRKNDRRRMQQFGGRGFPNGAYNDYYQQPYMGYGGMGPGMRSEYDCYGGYDGYTDGDYYGYDAGYAAYYGGGGGYGGAGRYAGGAYSGPARRGQMGQDSWYGGAGGYYGGNKGYRGSASRRGGVSAGAPRR
jgi:Q family heterogeneous nuclear ribonucleoprotein R